MSEGIFDYRSEVPRTGSRLVALVPPLAVFLLIGIFLAIGFSMNAREIPSPRIGKLRL